MSKKVVPLEKRPEPQCARHPGEPLNCVKCANELNEAVRRDADRKKPFSW